MSISVIYFSPLFITTYLTKIEQKVHMYYERGKNGFDFRFVNFCICFPLSHYSAYPRGQWDNRIPAAEWGGTLYTETCLLQQTKGLTA